MAVAAAGPATNLVLALLGAIALGALIRAHGTADPGAVALFVAHNLNNFLLINIFVALFNMLPIPPFDGSHVIEGLLPGRAALAYERLRPWGFPLVLLLLIGLPMLIPGLNLVQRYLVPPVLWLSQQYYALVRTVAGI